MRFRTPKELGGIIRQKRRTLGLDQQELARMVGISRQRIVAIERGKSGAALGLVLRTLFALGIELDASDPPPGKSASARTSRISMRSLKPHAGDVDELPRAHRIAR